MQEVCDVEARHMSRLQQVLNIVDRCEARSAPGARDPLTLSECATLLNQLQTEFKDEYQMYDLWTMSIALVFPLVSRPISSHHSYSGCNAKYPLDLAQKCPHTCFH